MIELLVVLIIIGVILGVVNAVVPMHPSIKMIINAVAIIMVLLIVLSAFGLIDFPITHLRRIR